VKTAAVNLYLSGVFTAFAAIHSRMGDGWIADVAFAFLTGAVGLLVMSQGYGKSAGT